MPHDHEQTHTHTTVDEQKKPLESGALSKLTSKRRSEIMNLVAALKTVHTAFYAMETAPKIKITISPGSWHYECRGNDEFCAGIAEMSTIYGCGCYSMREGGVGCDCPD